MSDLSPRPDHSAQGSSVRKISPHNFWLLKTSGGWGSRRNCRILKRLLLKGLQGLRTHPDPPPLGFSTRATVGKVQVGHGKKRRK